MKTLLIFQTQCHLYQTFLQISGKLLQRLRNHMGSWYLVYVSSHYITFLLIHWLLCTIVIEMLQQVPSQLNLFTVAVVWVSPTHVEFFCCWHYQKVSISTNRTKSEFCHISPHTLNCIYSCYCLVSNCMNQLIQYMYNILTKN